jgi:regulator of sigma D
MTKKDLEKQIELLVKDDERSQQTIIKQSEEIERLNNIINELEKDLQSNMAYYDNLYEELDEQEYIDKYFALKEVFEKLQELKGSDKE